MPPLYCYPETVKSEEKCGMKAHVDENLPNKTSGRTNRSNRMPCRFSGLTSIGFSYGDTRNIVYVRKLTVAIEKEWVQR